MKVDPTPSHCKNDGGQCGCIKYCADRVGVRVKEQIAMKVDPPKPIDPRPVGEMRLKDDFNGDDASLISSIEALLDLDAKGCIAPSGIGGLARALLSSAGNRLSRDKPEPTTRTSDPLREDYDSEKIHAAGELCTFGPPKDRKPIWIVRFEDASRGDIIFNYEIEAINFYLRASDNWNCTLLSTVRIQSSAPEPTTRTPDPSDTHR